MTGPAIELRWTSRERPLDPRAAAATGEVADRLLERLRELPDDRLGRLRGVVGDDLLVVLGAPDDLPWVDGIVYLGRSEDAPALLVPTHQAPSVPEALLESAVLGRADQHQPPLALLPRRALLASVAAARPLSVEALGALRVPREADPSEGRRSA